MNKKCSIILSVSFLFIFFISSTYPQINLEWARYHNNGNSHDEARSLCLDDSLNVYVTGQATGGSGYVYKTLKYNPTGSLQWSVYYPYGAANKIIYTGSNNFFVSGSNGLININPQGNITLIKNGNFVDIQKGEDNYMYGVYGINQGIYSEKYNSDGSLLWSRIKQQPPPSPYNYWPTRLFQGVDNKINVAGRFSAVIIGHLITGTVFLTYDTLGNLIYDGGIPSGTTKEARDNYSHNNFFAGYWEQSVWQSEIILYKLNSGNSVLDTIHYNGPGNSRDEPNDIVSDNQGNIYIACRSWGVAVDYDFVILKYNTNGDLIWEYRFNGSQNSYDTADKIKVDNNGNVYASGTLSLNSHGIQIYTVKLSPEGQLLWSDKFSQYNSPSDSNYVKDLQLDNSGNIYICGKSRNSTYQRYDFLTLKYSNQTSVINNSEIFKKDYYILENYPNPFNPETNIRFNLPNKANVKIIIISSDGRTLIELTNSIYSSGEHTILWNAESFPSGIYFISFQSNNFKEIKKAILIK